MIPEWLLSHAQELTAFGNGVWAASALLTLIVTHLFLRSPAFRRLAGGNEVLTPIGKEFLNWIRLPALCTVAHRCYWNAAIFLAPEGYEYSPLMLEFKFVTLFFVICMAYGSYRGILVLLPKSRRREFGWVSMVWIAAVGVTAFLLV